MLLSIFAASALHAQDVEDYMELTERGACGATLIGYSIKLTNSHKSSALRMKLKKTVSSSVPDIVSEGWEIVGVDSTKIVGCTRPYIGIEHDFCILEVELVNGIRPSPPADVDTTSKLRTMQIVLRRGYC